MKNYPLYAHTRVYTLRELVSFCAKTHGDRAAFRFRDRKDERSVSYVQFKAEVEALGTALYSRGLVDCRVAVYGENSYPWLLAHFAVTCGKNVIVPIDRELEAEAVAALLRDSECRALIYSHAYADVADELRAMLPQMDFIDMTDLPDLVAQGAQSIACGNRAYTGAAVEKDDLASIVYTSGTTGQSKGVMLTHDNFCASAYGACCNALNTGTVLLVLPLHHTFALTASVFSIMMYGNPIYINKSLKRFKEDIKASRPQMIFVVPMILKALRESIWDTARKSGREKLLRRMVRISDALMLCGIDLRRKLFKSVLDALGGELDVLISGGAPLDPQDVKAFRSLGITVLNGYGITECGPIVAVERNRFTVPGSVGLPLCCNEVKISPEGEVLVRGENVMRGYYRRDEENAAAFVDGWFRTGDLGYIDRHGALHITGRLKNLIILSNGENIAAESIESLVAGIPYVKEVMAYGEDDRIVAEVYLDEETPDARRRIDEDVKALNRTLPAVRNIGKVVVRDTEFPKTTTRKIKRNHTGGR